MFQFRAGEVIIWHEQVERWDNKGCKMCVELSMWPARVGRGKSLGGRWKSTNRQGNDRSLVHLFYFTFFSFTRYIVPVYLVHLFAEAVLHHFIFL